MKISEREKQILHLIANELTTDEIAKQLYLSSHTVITHRKNLHWKMNARNVAGLVRRGFERGILEICDHHH